MSLAQTTAIPDANFEQALIDLGYDTGTPDGSVPTANISNIFEIELQGKNISSLVGLQDFTGLYGINCSNNQLTSLDVSANTNLGVLWCMDNQLTTLDVSANGDLEQLRCQLNQLSSLNVSNATKLYLLECDTNQLTSLDVGTNTDLETLTFNDNQLTSIDLGTNTSIEYLTCSDNQLTSLDLSTNTAIDYLECYDNQITSLDLSTNMALTYLDCENNQLTSLDVSTNTALEYLECDTNQITSLDLSTNTALEDLDCKKNQLTSLDLSTNTALMELNCSDNQLTTLDITAPTNLEAVRCKNNQLTSLIANGVDFTGVTVFQTTGNTGLSCIQVDNVTQANAVGDLQLDPGTSFSTSCGGCTVAVSASSTAVSCAGDNDGSVTANGSSGSTPYTFAWSTGASTSAVNGLAIGTYSVTITDAAGCTETTSTTVGTPGAIIAHTNATDAGCNNNSTASAMPTGGTPPYTYSWSNGATTSAATGLAQGDYTVTITDNNGCTQTGTVAVESGAASVPSTQLISEDCGLTLSAVNDYIYCETVANAQRYQFRIVNQTTGQVYHEFSPSSQPTARWMFLSKDPNRVVLDTDYSIQARAKVGGVWGCFGNACTVTTPSTVPATQLTGAHCNSTLSALNNYVFWSSVSGAQRYGLEVSGPNGYLVEAFTAANHPTGTFFALSTLPHIAYSTTYSVRIRSKVNGTWHAYGPACNVTTPAALPTPVIEAAVCNSTVSSLSQYVRFSAVHGAQRYQYEFRTASGTVLGTRSSPYYAPTSRFFAMAFVPGGAQPSTTYKVAVRAKVAGTWGTYGPGCSITTPAFKRNWLAGGVQDEAIRLLAMPNPTTANSTILLGADCDGVIATVRNTMGQVVSVQQFGSTNRFEIELKGAPGIYFVSVDAEQGALGQVKLVKQ